MNFETVFVSVGLFILGWFWRDLILPWKTKQATPWRAVFKARDEEGETRDVGEIHVTPTQVGGKKKPAAPAVDWDQAMKDLLKERPKND